MRIQLAAALVCASAFLEAQPGGTVTERMRIGIDGRTVTARKINGRWWSPDNRELGRTNVGWLWSIGGGNARHLVRFDHHYPADLAKAGLLDRSMGPDQVRAILGAPNSVFPSDRPEKEQAWDYYGLDGGKLSIKFSSSGKGIFTASIQPNPGSMPQDVPHLAFRFRGKAARDGLQPAVTQAPPPPPSRIITLREIQSVTAGMPRARLLEALGNPYSRSAITGADGSRETLRYQTESGGTIAVILIDGKVSGAPR